MVYTGVETIDANHLVAAVAQGVDYMRSDKSRRSRDDCLHAPTSVARVASMCARFCRNHSTVRTMPSLTPTPGWNPSTVWARSIHACRWVLLSHARLGANSIPLVDPHSLIIFFAKSITRVCTPVPRLNASPAAPGVVAQRIKPSTNSSTLEQ